MTTKTSTPAGAVLTSTFWSKMIRFGVACLLCALILKTVVAQADQREPATAVIHVAEPNVELWVDGHSYQIDEQIFEPVVEEWKPGTHKIEMVRGTYLLYAETIEVVAGQEIVITAWAQGKLSD